MLNMPGENRCKLAKNKNKGHMLFDHITAYCEDTGCFSYKLISLLQHSSTQSWVPTGKVNQKKKKNKQIDS